MSTANILAIHRCCTQQLLVLHAWQPHIMSLHSKDPTDAEGFF